MKEHRIISPVADVRETPNAVAVRGKMESQLVFGEIFHVEEKKWAWAHGYCAHDGYKGWIERKHLSEHLPQATHVVSAVRSHLYRDSSMKTMTSTCLSFGSRLSIIETDDGFSRISDGRWIYSKHIVPADMKDADYTAAALRFLETPYLWAGRSGFGIDCSGLVQVCLARAGIKSERDTGPQSETLGHPGETPRRGDFIFFKDHVGIMADDKNLINADAFHMKVVSEPLDAIVARRGEITAIRRLKE